MTPYAYIDSRTHAVRPQARPIAGTVANSAGGDPFPLDDWARAVERIVAISEAGRAPMWSGSTRRPSP